MRRCSEHIVDLQQKTQSVGFLMHMVPSGGLVYCVHGTSPVEQSFYDVLRAILLFTSYTDVLKCERRRKLNKATFPELPLLLNANSSHGKY